MEEENSQNLEIVNNMDVATLGLMPEQVKFVSLRVPFLSQLIYAICTFPIKLGLVKNDPNWKTVLVEKGLRTRGQPKRSEALYFHRKYGLMWEGGNLVTAIQAVLSEKIVYVLNALFLN